MPPIRPCICCQIVQGHAPVSPVYEDEAALAFMDIRPVSPGHVLLIPKTHFAYLWEMPSTLFQAMASCLPRLAQALKSVTAAAAIDVFNLNGASGGQTVFHVHFHLVPIAPGSTIFHRRSDEVMLRFHPRPIARQELDSFAARLRQALGADDSEGST